MNKFFGEQYLLYNNGISHKVIIRKLDFNGPWCSLIKGDPDIIRFLFENPEKVYLVGSMTRITLYKIKKIAKEDRYGPGVVSILAFGYSQADRKSKIIKKLFKNYKV